jgi:hypothetical protein
MKKTILVSLLILVITQGSFGQWYNKKFLVNDINHLSQEQLNGSLDETKENIFGSFGIAAVGGILMWIGNYTLKNGIDEDASLIEQLLGAQFMGRTYIVLGVGGAAGGTVAGLVFFGRYEKIRSVLKNNYGPTGSITISPAVVFNGKNSNPAPGLSVKLNF